MRYLNVFNYPGGKYRMLPKFPEEVSTIIEKCNTYVEPFAGSAVIALNLAWSIKEVNPNLVIHINDLDFGIYVLLSVLQDWEEGEEFQRRASNIRCNPDLFKYAKAVKDNGYKKNNGEYMNRVEIAIITFILLVISYNAQRKIYAPGHEGQLACKTKNIPLARERLQKMIITNYNAIDIIKYYRYDEKAFLCMDPPYDTEYRTPNLYEEDELSQYGYIRESRGVRCPALIFGYRPDEREGNNCLYDNELSKYKDRWSRTVFGHFPQTMGNQEGKPSPIGTEYIWHNFDIKGSKGLDWLE